LVVFFVSHSASRIIKNTVGGCDCAGGSTPLFGYETIPISVQGAGCIGSCNGNPYWIHTEQTTVKEIKIWLGGDSNGFRALYVQLFNGQDFVQGVIPASGPDASITFAVGETIVDDITICGNGVGSVVGYLAFTTSAGQKFSVGDQHTPYYFPSGNSFLTGFFGQSSDQVYQLGLYLMKPIKTGSLNNLKYPTLSSYTVGLSPQIYQTLLCNSDQNETQTQTATFTTTVGTKHIWSITSSFSIGESITVQAGVPEVASVSTEFHWEVSETSQYSQETDTTKTEEQQFPVQVGPRTKINATFSWWDSECDVPYTADLLYTFTDGSTYTFSVSDTFDGAFITTSEGDYNSSPLQPGEGCDSERHLINANA